MTCKVLVLDRHSDDWDRLAIRLAEDGYHTLRTESCAQAEALLVDRAADLLLVEPLLYDISAAALVRRLRAAAASRDLPILCVTQLDSEDHCEKALREGADDYIRKPFSVRELAARVCAVLRRRAPEKAHDAIEIDGLRLSRLEHRVTAGGQPVALCRIEFGILEYLMTHPTRLASRSRLLDQVWRGGAFTGERAVDVHILRLRKALAPSGYAALIETVRGEGYRLAAGQTRAAS